MFIGEYEHSIDIKGRVSFPSKFRDVLGEIFYMTKGLDSSIFVFPKAEWEIFEEKLKGLPLTNNNARAFVRMFFSGAQEISFDKQGRIVIPQGLRNHANLESDAYIIGVGTRIEIWDKKTWDEYTSPNSLNYDEIAAHMAELGI
jgi:MraZ protein